LGIRKKKGKKGGGRIKIYGFIIREKGKKEEGKNRVKKSWGGQKGPFVGLERKGEKR